MNSNNENLNEDNDIKNNHNSLKGHPKNSYELEYLYFHEKAESFEENRLSLLDLFGKEEKYDKWQAILSSIAIITLEQEKHHPMGELLISDDLLEIYSKSEFSVEIDELLYQNNNRNASFFNLEPKDSPRKANKRSTFLKNSMRHSNRIKGDMKFEVNEMGFKASRILRNTLGISSADYLKSIDLYDNFNLNLAEAKDLKSKSSSTFFFTADHKLVFKSLDKSEFQKWREMLGSYYRYVIVENSQSLIVRIIGTYEFKFENSGNRQYIVMENIYQDNMREGEMISLFDLKGSLEGRTVPGCQEEYKKRLSEVMKGSKKNIEMSDVIKGKDQDAAALDLELLIPLDLSSLFKDSLKKDCDFLSGHSLMDYSLIYSLSLKKNEREGMNLWKRIYSSEKPDLMSSFGIVDFLQEYSAAKFLETQFKSLFFGMQKISCVDPEKYAKRFSDFIATMITK